ncbi:MAG: hypothetical protein CSA21_05645 [Deltaproteobacteria bacterium]|nr:MAG: hypothetical protein CSA21_05645 [Deltaproteobacteria bacterium]
MTNEILWTGFALFDLLAVLAVFRFFGKAGLFAMIVFSLLTCNIQVIKTIQLFGITTTLGNVLYASVFLTTDILSECYGKKAARQGVLLGFTALILVTLYMQIALAFTPGASDFAQPHLQAIFGFMPRIAIGSMAAYLVSQWHDVWAFHLLKSWTNDKYLWLRNNGSTLISQALDTLIFCTIAFWGVFEWSVWLQIVVSTYLVKTIMGVMDTPFLYLARRIHKGQI